MRLPAAAYVAAVAAAFGASTGLVWIVDRNNNTLAGLLDAVFVIVGIGALELWAYRRRRRRAPEQPAGGTATFLFTDIEGSTALVRQLGDLYAGVLERHASILHRAVAGRGGHVVDTQGDAVFAVFARPGDAVLAALAAQRELAEEHWPGDARVAVRMGIHTGPVSQSGDRYVGLAVHRAARIGAAAGGGQILLSETTRRMLEDEEPSLPRLSFTDLGPRELKDFDRSVRLFDVTQSVG